MYDGWKQFNLNCARCHGEDAQGTTIAPHLIVSLKPDGPINTKELFIQTVCAGRPAKGMPSWCALGMEMPTIEAIYSYVKGRSDAKIHPGRPAVKIRRMMSRICMALLSGVVLTGAGLGRRIRRAGRPRSTAVHHKSPSTRQSLLIPGCHPPITLSQSSAVDTPPPRRRSRLLISRRMPPR